MLASRGSIAQITTSPTPRARHRPTGFTRSSRATTISTIPRPSRMSVAQRLCATPLMLGVSEPDCPNCAQLGARLRAIPLHAPKVL